MCACEREGGGEGEVFSCMLQGKHVIKLMKARMDEERYVEAAAEMVRAWLDMCVCVRVSTGSPAEIEAFGMHKAAHVQALCAGIAVWARKVAHAHEICWREHCKHGHGPCHCSQGLACRRPWPACVPCPPCQIQILHVHVA